MNFCGFSLAYTWPSASMLATVSPWNLLRTQILRPHPRPTESETPRWGLAICVFTSPPGNSDAHSVLKTIASDKSLWLRRWGTVTDHFLVICSPLWPGGQGPIIDRATIISWSIWYRGAFQRQRRRAWTAIVRAEKGHRTDGNLRNRLKSQMSVALGRIFGKSCESEGTLLKTVQQERCPIRYAF